MVRFVIGRGDDCDVVLPAASISRRHAYVTPRPNGMLRFEDAGSTNGSFHLEGESLVRFNVIDLRPEASVQFGKVRLSVAELLMRILTKGLQTGGGQERRTAMERPSHGDPRDRA